jgi:hypothetical protein
VQEIKYDFYKSKDESPRHYRYKWRLYKILAFCGCYPVGLERAYPCRIEQDKTGRSREYRVDVSGYLYCIHEPGSEPEYRQINVEIDGTIGHKEKHGCDLDKLKIRSIKECYGQHIETYRFTFKQLACWSDEEVAEEMRLFYYDK